MKQITSRRGFAIVVVVFLFTVGTVAGATILTASAGGSYEAPSGLTVNTGTATDVDDRNPFTSSDTVQLDGVTFSASGPANVTVQRFTGAWTNVSAIEATSTDITINPNGKSAVTIGGGVTALQYRTDADTAIDDGQTDFIYSAASSGQITLTSLPANTDFSAATASGTVIGSFSTDGSGSATISVPAASSADVQLFTSKTPTLSNETPTGKVTTYDGNVSIEVTDADFGSQTDEVTVTATDDSGQTIGSTTITSNTTVQFAYSAPPGANNVTWDATDGYGNTRTLTQQFTTPATIEVYYENDTSRLVDDTTLQFRFFGEGDTVIERSVSNGRVSLTGLPAQDRFVVTISNDTNFFYRRVIIESIYEQSEVYLLPDDTDGARVEFRLEDFTGGQFDARQTRLYIRAPITKDFDNDSTDETQYRTIFGDNFGSAASFPAVLERNERYRLRLENEDGDVRILGSYTASADEVAPLRVQGLEFDPPEGQGYETNLTLSPRPARSLTWKFMDPSGETSDLSVRVLDENDTVVYSDSLSGTVENYSIYGIALANDTDYRLEWTATRAGSEIGQTRPIGGRGIPEEIPFDADWLGTFGVVGVVFILSLADVRKASYVAMSAVGFAGVLMFLQAVDIFPPFWWAAALIAAGNHLRTIQEPSV